MRQCPFCAGDVSEDTLMYGGSCPKCFGEIPGEEAATDPGEVVKAAQDKSDNRRKMVKTMIPLLLAVPLMGGLAVLAIGFMIWNRAPTIETMVFDDIEEFNYAIVSAPEPEPASAKVAKSTIKRPTGPKTAVVAAVKPEVDAMGIPLVKAEKATGGLSFTGIGVTASRSGELLKEPGAIRKMIAQKMRMYGPQLKLCYDKRLKTREDLQGRWTAKFVVMETGYPTKVSFRGNEMKDAEMEKCMVTAVKRWKFGRIAHPQPVEKNWRFRR